MNKKVILSVIVVLGLWATQIHAQSTSFGVKADVNMSNFVISDMSVLKSSMKVGGGIGGFLRTDLSPYFAIQPEVKLSYQSSRMELASEESDYTYSGLEIPVYAMAQLVHGEGSRYYFGLGPVLDYGFSSESGDVNLYKDAAASQQLQRFNMGVGILLGYEFPLGLQINVNYKYGLINVLKEPIGDASLHQQRVSIGIGYRF